MWTYGVLRADPGDAADGGEQPHLQLRQCGAEGLSGGGRAAAAKGGSRLVADADAVRSLSQLESNVLRKRP